MDSSPLICSQCTTPLHGELLTSGQPGPCKTCEATTQALVFPALFREVARGETGQTILVDGEASCFYHAQKRASVPCDECGRFLCPVCDIEFNNGHICPSCLQGNQQGKGRPDFIKNRVPYDSLALSIIYFSTAAVCLVSLWAITGAAAIFFAIFSWYQPPGPIRRTRARAIVAIVLGLVQIIACIGFWTKLASA
jgi:hypothetical protein